MKHLFIVNPIAGGADKSELVTKQVTELFASRDDEYEIYVTHKPMDAPEKIRKTAAECDHLRVYACGGDGTFNECVCGVFGLDNAAVCPYPTGTGNDFCRMFGEEKDLYRNLDAMVNGSEHPIDVIDCNGRCSVNICSVGIDARIGVDVHKYSKLPIIGGAAGYVVSTVVNVFKGISSPMTVDSGEFHVADEQTLICACNGRYYGGGFNPSPDARPDDGIMDVYVIKKVGLFTLARLIGKYATGKADSIPKYATHLRTDKVRIRFNEKTLVNLDGEAIYTDDVTMKLIPKSLNLVVPRGLHFFDQ